MIYIEQSFRRLGNYLLEELLPLCEQKGISVILGGPYNSGILASDLADDATFNYLPAPQEILEKARRIKAVCDTHDVPLKAAALQFLKHHPEFVRDVELEEKFIITHHPCGWLKRIAED